MSRAVEDCLLRRRPAQSDRAGGESPFACGEAAVTRKNCRVQRFIPVVAACVLALAGFFFGEGASAQMTNNPPSFTSSNTESVAENTTAVLTVVATDADTEDSVTGYTKSGGADAAKFALTSAGVLSFASAPDFENPTDAGDTAQNNTYVVEVTATSGTGAREMTATQTITVTVTDVGGEVPGAPDLPALDRDVSTRVLVTYTAPANPGPPITGYSVRYRRTDTDPVGSWSSSRCAAQPRREHTFSCSGLVASGHYAFQVRAENADGAGAWSGSAVTDNDPPVFDTDLSGKSWAVPENTGPGVNVGDPVTATDPDNGAVTYYLEKRFSTDPTPPFTIGNTTGQLATKTGHTYDHEARPQGYTFYVVAKDPAGGIARFNLSVPITDVAEPPTSIPASLKVTATPGGRLNVTWTAAADDEQKPPITSYDIRYRTPYGSGSWETHKSTGIVVTHEFGNIPATETTVTGLTPGSEYQVQIAARNAEGAEAWSDSVRVTAIDNQSPSFTETGPVTRSVAENTPAGRDVGAPVAATDQDGGTLAYNLEGTDADSFTIDGGNGQIRTKTGVTYNFEANATYEVTVRVDDGQGGHATIAVTITLTDVEEDLKAPAPPTFSASTDTSFTVVWAPPEDTGKAITGYDVQYRNIVGNRNWKSKRLTGTNTTAEITGLIAQSTYEVQVRSLHGSEESPWSETAEVDLAETAIRFKEGASASRELPENTVAAVAVGADIEASINGFPLRVIGFSLEGADAEAFDLVGPSIAPSTPPFGSARLTTTDDGYNYEEQASYAVTVVATAGTVTARLPVTITVLDDDTEAPAAPPRPSVQPESLTSLTVTWAEPENAGPAITTYHVQYTVEGAASWTSVTNLGTGLTTTLASLTEGTTYEVQVQAVNAEGPGDWSESGTGAPGNPVPNELPVFDDSPPVTRQVPENTGAGVDVGAPVTATDEGPSIEYGLEGADGSAFTIDTATGQIRTTNAGYDHEDKSSYAVTVTATDDRQGVARLNVTIEVENLPEAPAAPGPPSVTTVSPVSVTATWAAPVDNAGRPPITRYQVQYRTPPATGTWQDWPHPGTARTVTITGLESGTAYEVQVRAINNDGPSDAELPGPWAAGTGRTSPNQPPAFTEGTSTSRTLAENPAVDVAIGAPVAATDPENHLITYTLEGTDREAFSIDDTGGLRTVATAVYDFEAQPTYALDVVATDEFGAAARIAVTVTLTDVPEALSATNASAAEAAGPLVFTVTRVAAGTPVSVAWRTVNGTATAGRDYTAASGTLTFAANETEKTIRVTLLDDAISEGDETLAVTLDDPDNATVVRALGTILDDDPVPGVSIAAATADEGAGTMIFPVTLSAIRENDAVTVAWTTADGTATAGPDYAAATGTLTFAPGETEQPLAVTLLDDEISEDNETFTVMLSDPVHGTITTATATGTIVDNDAAGLSGHAVTNREPPPVEVLLGAAVSRVLEGLKLAVTVSLSADPMREVTVPLVATPGTAGPDDYALSATSVTFASGETSKTVIVEALADDLEDEPDETMTLAVGADLPAKVTAGARPETEVTIENRTRLTAVVQAWTARFGRTAATHVTDAVGERLRAAPGQDSHVTVGGYQLSLGKAVAGETEPGSALLEGLAGLLGLGPARSGGAGPNGGFGTRPGSGGAWLASGAGPDPRLGQSRPLAVDLRRILLGSSFRLTLGADDDDGASASRLTAWGRFAGTTFDGQDGALAVDGDVFTGTVGVDSEWDRLLAGVAVAHSRGAGSFMNPTMEAHGQGGLEQTLTSLHPYLRYAVTERLDVWGLVGYGWGELDLELENGMTLETDTTLLMGAFGGRGIVLAPEDTGGFQLATRTDAMLTRTSTDAAAPVAATDADAHRVRVILEGSRAVAWADGRRLTPTLELGLRHDWGDAETGFGLEVGSRVHYADPRVGLTVEGAVRGLLAHEDAGYEEWGASGTVRLAPGVGGQGLSLTLAPTWGAAASGIEGLWSRQTTAGLASPGLRPPPAGRLQAEVGYGFAAFARGLLTPYAGTVLTEGAARTYRVGARWADATGLSLNLEGTRQEAVGPQPVQQGVQVRATWGF